MATDDKYGRQLRLWGANGQAALMGAHVLLLGAEPTGSETLKNLVLPGLGLVAVVDGGDATASDLASSRATSSLSPPRSAASAPTSTSSCSAR